MINIKNLNKQHTSIESEIEFILSEVKKAESNIDSVDVAMHINKLSGLLKVHFIEEDKFLYPRLKNCGDFQIQRMSEEYKHEMGDLSLKFIEFKNNYNTGSKINNDMDGFVRETTKIMQVLLKRIHKEDNELYQLIEEKNL